MLRLLDLIGLVGYIQLDLWGLAGRIIGLATLAALSPPSLQVELMDENTQPIPIQPPADIIGICGMGVQFRRQQKLLICIIHELLAQAQFSSIKIVK